MSDFLTEDEARKLVDFNLKLEDKSTSTQEIIDSGVIPILSGFKVRPGKVSDSIVGGKFSIKGQEYENPPLNDINGIPLRIMVRTQRISTHDITRGEIPFKDQILAANHNFMRRLLTPAIGTSQYELPGLSDNAVVIVAENLTQVPFENVLRAFMAKSSTETSLYQHYIKGERKFCGHNLPEGLIPNGKLPYVMDTPSTKSEEHDESVSPQMLIQSGVCTPAQYMEIRNSSLYGFGIVSEFLRTKGLIAVDTKTEHGINREGKIVSQDEIWTMDSSRFWLANDYTDQLRKLKAGEITELNPKSYSKEFARGFSKGEQGYTLDQIAQISVRYILGVQHLLGTRFEPDLRKRDERVIDGLEKAVTLAF